MARRPDLSRSVPIYGFVSKCPKYLTSLSSFTPHAPKTCSNVAFFSVQTHPAFIIVKIFFCGNISASGGVSVVKKKKKHSNSHFRSVFDEEFFFFFFLTDVLFFEARLN